MPDDLKSERILVLMSRRQVEAIDEWAFAQRPVVRSRGEAIRRLIDRGLDAERGPSAEPRPD